MTALHVYISRLRKLLPRNALVTQPPGYCLRADPDAVDVERFDRLVRAAQDAEPQTRADLLREALDLWCGAPLAEFAAEPFGRPEAGRLLEARLRALELRIDADLAVGLHAEVVVELERLVAEYPTRESFRAQRMLALYRAARQADALAEYRRARAQLAELGLEPGEELKDLQRRILAHDPSLGFAPPQRVPRVCLPRSTSSFLGRSDELDRGRVLLVDARRHVVSVTGTGGIGKTRFAVELASLVVDDFDDGVAFVALDTAERTEGVDAAICEALKLREDSSRTALERLIGYLDE